MKDIDIERLLWERRDGQLGEDELRTIERLAANDSELDEKERAIEALDTLLSRVERVEPPRELRGKIEWALGALENTESRNQQRHLDNQLKGGQSMSGSSNRSWLYLAAAAVIVVAAILFFSGGDKVPPEEVTGAIGGVEQAEKYAGETLSEEAHDAGNVSTMATVQATPQPDPPGTVQNVVRTDVL